MQKELEIDTPIDRRRLLQVAGISAIGLVGATTLIGCGGNNNNNSTPTSNMDAQILGAAKIAEALAVTMYTAIITKSPWFSGLPTNDQLYLTAARDEEMYHYLLLKGATGGTDAQTTYYFPMNMFTDKQTTINVLVTLEDAFIAAYLIGVGNLSTSSLRVLAAQIMGIESDHRTLARVVASDLGLTTSTGLSGSPEVVATANDNVYERTYGLTQIGQVVAALTKFLSASSSNPVAETFNPAYVPNNAGLFPNPANG